MVIEIDNIIRAVEDIRQAALSLEAKISGSPQTDIAKNISWHADQIEKRAADLESEIKGSEKKTATITEKIQNKTISNQGEPSKPTDVT